MHDNLILMTDAYKQTHHLQYPKEIQTVYSYLESRGGVFDSTVFFGLQYYLKRYLTQPVLPSDVREADEFCTEVFGTDKYFNRVGWNYIAKNCEGLLPLRIRAVPEGMDIPCHNVLMTIENTDPLCPWVTNFIETLLMKIWYPISVCTLSHRIKLLFKKYYAECGILAPVNPFMLNDFGYRGVSSEESAALGGAAHLVNFIGTDTLAGIRLLKEYYYTKTCGYSVMASEHSTTTIYGKDNELQAYQNFLAACPEGILSIVADSYDMYHTVANLIGDKLKAIVLEREGKVVIRPDSGIPHIVSVSVLNMLWESFGGTTNEKGFRVLNPKVGVIYGDGINYNSIDDILSAVVHAGYSVENMVFGMGGALLQQVNRDTHKFAFKCSAAFDGVSWRDVYKDPTTDKAKASKRGRLKLVDTGSGYMTVGCKEDETHTDDVLQVVYDNGYMTRSMDLADVKANLAVHS